MTCTTHADPGLVPWSDLPAQPRPMLVIECHMGPDFINIAFPLVSHGSPICIAQQLPSPGSTTDTHVTTGGT